MADLGEMARLSLLAVEAWTQNINNNMIGANKTGYKTTRITFGAGNPQLVRAPASGILPVQFTEPTMRVIQSTVEFLPGQIVSSTQATHFAIKDRLNSPGTNFFVLQDPGDPFRYYLSRDGEFHFASNVSVKVRNPSNPNGDIPGVGPQSTTVTGDFLVNNYGLVVIGSGNRGYMNVANDPSNPNDNVLESSAGALYGADIKLAYGTTALAEDGTPSASTTLVAPALIGSVITRDRTMHDPFADPSNSAANGFQRATGLTYVNSDSSTVANSGQTGFAIHNNPLVVNIRNPQNLIFSRFGSTIFDFSIAGSRPTTTTTPGSYDPAGATNKTTSGNAGSFDPLGSDTWDFDATGTGARPLNNSSATALPGSTAKYPTGYVGQGPFADRLDKSLEQSTSSITTLIPELTLAQKMFTAVSKLITVYGQNIDTLNNLIR